MYVVHTNITGTKQHFDVYINGYLNLVSRNEKGSSPGSNLNFYDQMVREEKGWVEHEFLCSLLFAALPHETRLPNE